MGKSMAGEISGYENRFLEKLMDGEIDGCKNNGWGIDGWRNQWMRKSMAGKSMDGKIDDWSIQWMGTSMSEEISGLGT